MGVTDTPTVDLTKTGTGSQASPIQLTAAVKRSAVAGQLLTEQADGLAVTCESVQDCVGQAMVAGQGLAYNDAANSMSAKLSTAAGNIAAFGADGGVYVPAGGAGVSVQDTPCVNLEGNGGAGAPLTATLTLRPIPQNMLTCQADGLQAIWTPGCGLAGRGSVADPARINTPAWPFVCSPAAGGQPLGCEANVLYAPPVQRVLSSPDSQSTTPPAGTNAHGFCVTHAYTVNNPDNCRTLTGFVLLTAIARLLMEPGAEIIVSLGGGDQVRFRNDSPAARQLAQQVVATSSLSIPPGSSQTINAQVCLTDTVGSGSDVVQISTAARIMGVSQ